MASPASPGTPGLVEGPGPHVPLPTPSHYTRGGPTPPDYRPHATNLRSVSNSGADDRDRTGDLVLTKDVLCQLSYIGQHPGTTGEELERETGIEPATNSLEGCDSTTELLPPT